MTLKIDFDDGIEYALPAGRRPSGGVQIRKDPGTGADVFMYKRKPGVFYSANGLEVSQTMAKRAGFDVEFLAKMRKQQQDLVAYQAEIAAKMGDKIQRVVAERNGYRLEEHPGVGFIVFHAEDNKAVSSPTPSKSMGLDWLSDFAGPDVPGGFDGTPESVKGPDDDVQRPSIEGVGRANRRSGQDGGSARNVRAAGNS